ncbi:MAG: hypothetical protein JRE88_12170 [Deltaproteobacteria bacterium]|jgi:hypothetical protein|nr:hypothetical protein [Deltaproteobacteria bacterium]
MLSQRLKTVARLHPEKSVSRNPRKLKKPVGDRRTGVDRRQSFDNGYFLKGGFERRSWKERRYLWYMTE